MLVPSALVPGENSTKELPVWSREHSYTTALARRWSDTSKVGSIRELLDGRHRGPQWILHFNHFKIHLIPLFCIFVFVLFFIVQPEVKNKLSGPRSFCLLCAGEQEARWLIYTSQGIK